MYRKLNEQSVTKGDQEEYEQYDPYEPDEWVEKSNAEEDAAVDESGKY